MTVLDLYMIGKREIKNKNDVILLFKSIFGFDRLGISLNSNIEVNSRQKEFFLNKLEQLKSNVPIQYIVGNIDFLDFNLKCGEGVFIPREETEILVNEVIKRVNKNFEGNIVDLCSGTGNVGIGIKSKAKKCNVFCIEKSPEAFEYLEHNKKNIGVSVNCILGDIFDKVNDFEDGTFDIIVSNPPYIKTSDISTLDANIQYEPRLALDGGEDGLYFYRKILSMWKKKLKVGGFFAFEIGYNQYDEMKKIVKYENLKNVDFIKDDNGHYRVCICS